MRVIVSPPDPDWPRVYAAEAARLRDRIGRDVVAMHHIGSTAIPGLPAKPVIDILLEATSLERLDRSAHSLEALGYEIMGEFGIPGRRYFRKNAASGERTHQVHAFAAGSGEIARHLAFRDYMRAKPEAAEAYGRLKIGLAGQHPADMPAYMDGKDGFIKTHEVEALRWAAARRGA